MTKSSSVRKEITTGARGIEEARKIERRRAMRRLLALSPKAEVGKSRQSEYVDLVISDSDTGQVVAASERS